MGDEVLREKCRAFALANGGNGATPHVAVEVVNGEPTQVVAVANHRLSLLEQLEDQGLIEDVDRGRILLVFVGSDAWADVPLDLQRILRGLYRPPPEADGG